MQADEFDRTHGRRIPPDELRKKEPDKHVDSDSQVVREPGLPDVT